MNRKIPQLVKKRFITYKGINWQFYEAKGKGRVVGLPWGTGVYMITILSKWKRNRILAYIGATNCLSGRLYSHPVLNKLKFNCKEYNIQVLFKDFGNLKSNFLKESELINKFMPPFNRKNMNRIKAFWKSIGVSTLYGKYYKTFIKVSDL